jgi:hypothetical protein
MSTLAELLPLAPGMTDAELKDYALILSPELATALAQIQAALGERRHMAIPVLLTTGDFLLRADLLTEIHPGGLYHAGFAAIPTNLLPSVQVIPWADALALLPTE